MASITAFSGPAGSGKTFAIFEELRRVVDDKRLEPHQSVLAITFMHGSRRRLADKLRVLSKAGISAKCDTIDSFCMQLVNRFRRRLGKPLPISISKAHTSEEWRCDVRGWKASFDAIRLAAIALLSDETVRICVAAAYPVVVVDEFQDCEGELLQIVELLSKCTSVLIAADDFQHLSDQPECPATNWLRNSGADIRELSGNRRTTQSLLQETASALREGRQAVRCIEVRCIAAGLAAWHISSRIAWGHIPAGTSKALICPVNPSSSRWLRDLMTSLGRELGQAKKAGPTPFKWSGGEKELLEEADAIVKELTSTSDMLSKPLVASIGQADNHVVRTASRRALRLLSLRGAETLERAEFTEMVQQASHSMSSFRPEHRQLRLAMTVHGAKNQEFDHVFIAWPYEVTSNALLARKLLYNAVTRAKGGAVLFVQGEVDRVESSSTLQLLRNGVVVESAAKKAKRGRGK